ncbi:putative RING zinc finger domain superfamily protein isoform X1 [Zea mays]|uniref:RING-type E3 ubiquitin transferase n=1 Tax=Zea mays TaxID=4577 RepID=K7V7Z9_MAIZE|nr:putative RING zinc finger domain superfamily protein isoform X1 [Zea mays]XP_008654308.1 putative RING zinc finger domain superfamily protein isoform X1 [Zea mays]AQK97150.1 RING/U-box superfamily protein [Zea mays]AQK97153.1 RING/U-box superfamily protein [Zea mays]AQK97156.1 RING/U-box superfamily protein [Zea mays]|eukprot:XP_008654307.1 putative RING zinc finger domain superfamily protein isoform X1 [Zea mays]
MAFRNMVCTPQVINLTSDSERGQAQGGNGSEISEQGAQHAVRVVGNAMNIGLSGVRSYYDMSINHHHQSVHNPPPNLGVDSGFVFASNMYNPCMSSTSMNRHVSHAQSFGSGNQVLPQNQVPGTMDESSRNDSIGESAREHIKRKNAAVAGSYHFVNGFASSSSSSHAPQNPMLGPWDPSFESTVSSNVAPFNPSEYHGHNNSWPSLEGSSITGSNGFNSMVVHPDSVQRGNYTFPPTHISHSWMSHATNGIADGVPQWEYANATANIQGRFAHSGATEIANVGFHEYQNGPSTICRGPVPYFHQHAMHGMQALDPTQMQVPYQQCHSNGFLHGGINYPGNRLQLGPRNPVLFTSSERAFGPPQHPFLANPVNHRNIRILPPEQHATIMDFSRLYEVSNTVDEHRDMRLDIDSMTYEELLALEEQIGDVNTGLTKSHIVDKLRTSLYVPGISSMSDQPSKSSLENDACIICQEEYQARDCVGTLDCGHRYHAECVKQWLMVKNLCPICKTTALSANRRQGQ